MQSEVGGERGGRGAGGAVAGVLHVPAGAAGPAGPSRPNTRPPPAGEPRGAVAGVLHVPAGPADLAGHYDLTISHPRVGQPEFVVFEQWLAEAAGAFGLTCGLIHDAVVHEAVRRLPAGQLSVGYHLDYFAL